MTVLYQNEEILVAMGYTGQTRVERLGLLPLVLPLLAQELGYSLHPRIPPRRSTG